MIAFARLRLSAARAFACASTLALAGCVDSTAPILSDAQPLIGQRVRIAFYGVHDGFAHEPASATYRWRSGRYERTAGLFKDVRAFTVHEFEGTDRIVQNIQPGKPVEYALARRLADGTFLVVAIDEQDADEVTRNNFCGKEANTACRIETREQLLAFARATAAKPHERGGLAVLIAD
jgi:hypothetical protein